MILVNLITINNLIKYWYFWGFLVHNKITISTKAQHASNLDHKYMEAAFYFHKLVLDKPMILNCIDMGSVFVTNSTHIFIPIIYVATRTKSQTLKN